MIKMHEIKRKKIRQTNFSPRGKKKDILGYTGPAQLQRRSSNAVMITDDVLKVHKHEIFLNFFFRNRKLMVPWACKTRFLKIVFDSAEIFDF
jgi:hypothetical protein